MDEGRLFGRSMAFPPQVGPDGRIAWSQGPDNVRESIRLILLTEPGERVMLHEFGAGLGRFLFQPNIVSTHRAIEDAIAQSIARWEPRAQVSAVEVEAAPDDPETAIATIRYTLVASRTSEQLRLRLPLGRSS